MHAHRIHIKLYFEEDKNFDPEDLIPVFHRFIQHRVLDELPIDVADYRHVANGPNLLLITHQADIVYDTTDGRPGLLYARKRPQEGSFPERIRHSLRQTLRAGFLLQQEAPALRWDGRSWSLRLADRLRAPNTRDTFAAVEPVLLEEVAELYRAGGFQLTWEEDPKDLFGIQVLASERNNLSTLLERITTSKLTTTAA